MKECSYGLALEGGGARGSYQIGAYKALVESGFRFSSIVGTSIGAINAAVICSGGLELLEGIWKEIDSSIFEINPQMCDEIKQGNKQIKRDVTLDILKNHGISLNKLKDILNKYVDEEKVRNNNIKFGLVITKLKGMKSLEYTIDDIPKGKLIDYLIASSSLPIFKIEKNIDEHIYLDGGFRNVLPLTLLENMGCKNIIGIRLKKFGIIRKTKNKDTKVFLIEPSKSTGSTLFFNQDTIDENIKLGYNDAKKMIDKIKN